MVVKVGSSSISGESSWRIPMLVHALAAAHARGTEVILVSSGAIATGIPFLNLDARPTDLATQHVVNDPEGRLADWKEQLARYPEPLRDAVLRHYREILSYWAADYHYASKVERRDLVFLVGIAGKLANAILQVVFALNRSYYPGDGWNLPMAAELELLPPDFTSRMAAILQPGRDPDAFQRQRTELIAMIADLEVLIAA